MTKIHSLFYHNPNPIGFERMIKYHLRRGYRFISVEELYKILKCRQPLKERLAFISFDDGWRDNLQLLPIIEKYNVPICIFVVTESLQCGNFWWEYVEKELGHKKMLEFKKLPYDEFTRLFEVYKKHHSLQRSAITVDELKTLSSHPLVSIQSHTVKHLILTKWPESIVEEELADSKKDLADLTGHDIFAFSYPNGTFTQREVEVCKHHYSIAFTTKENHISLNDDLYLLPRYSLTGNIFRDILQVWGIWKRMRKVYLFLKGCDDKIE